MNKERVGAGYGYGSEERLLRQELAGEEARNGTSVDFRFSTPT